MCLNTKSKREKRKKNVKSQSDLGTSPLNQVGLTQTIVEP